jgi:predicted RNA-binding protein Jag
MKKDQITQTLKEITQKMGIIVDGIETTDIAGHTIFTIQTKDSGALIGARGDTLSALNMLMKKVYEDEDRDSKDTFRFVVDVNGYHMKHIKALENQAHMLAERARTFKYDIEMSPMSGYDRMIIHAALQGSPNVYTSSVGEGAMRHIVVHYSETGAPNTPSGDTSEQS